LPQNHHPPTRFSYSLIASRARILASTTASFCVLPIIQPKVLLNLFREARKR
jgi:hypothetical protein